MGIGNLTFLKSARAIRLIRLLRVVRLAKLQNLKHRDLDLNLGLMGVNIGIYVVALSCALLFTGTLMYLVEGNNDAFASIPLAMLWSFKVFLTEVPIAEPLTVGGQVIHMVTMFTGLVLFGLLIGAMANILDHYLFQKNEN